MPAKPKHQIAEPRKVRIGSGGTALRRRRRGSRRRSGQRRQSAEEDGPVLPALEPAVRLVELLGVQMQPAAVPLEVGTAAAEPDPPAPHRAQRVADRARERDAEVRLQAGLQRPAEELDVLARERAAATAPP